MLIDPLRAFIYFKSIFSMDKSHSVLLVGGPDAGKTNFLFRLWLALRKQNGRLHADGLPDEIKYLESGVGCLLSGKFAPRTQSEEQNRTAIPVKDGDSAKNFHGTLVVPDCWGEEWQQIYQKREWSEDWENIISDTCGCLLFVRADSEQIVAPFDWISCERLFGSPSFVDNALQNNGEELVPPTQVIMIDWLQCLKRAFIERVGGNFRPRIGIVIAAWDLVPPEQHTQGPDLYISSNFPMLKQFIQTNTDRFEFATFGVSIVGGDLKNTPNFREEFLNGDPQETGYVVYSLNGEVERSNDITLPVAWAMRLEM